MLRFILAFLFLGHCTAILAQGVDITRSNDIVVIRGVSYYLHTVQPGQTLYSICKAYGANVDEIKTLNDKKDNRLSLYEVLKVPYTKPEIRQDDKYYYYKVAKGETLYFIARKFGIKPKRLLKYNPEYAHGEPVSVGAVIKLPLKEVDLTALELSGEKLAAGPWEERAKQTVEPFPEERETEIVLAPKVEYRDSLPVATGETIEQEKAQIPEYISEVVMPADPFVRVALLLPFSAGEYPSFASDMPVKISARSDQFLAFYEGILLAVDSLKSRGCKVELHVFDTERSAEKMYMLAEDINRLRPDLIIGPVYGSVYKAMAQSLWNKHIPMIYPLSSRSENFAEFPDFVQINPSFHALTAAMVDWLSEQSEQANIIGLHWKKGEVYTQTDRTEQQLLKERLQQTGKVNFFEWDVRISLDSFRAQLLPDRENIIVVPAMKEADVSKILPVLSALTDSYRITVVGLPEWQSFTSVDHETYYKLNTKILTYSYIDYASSAARTLTEKYRKYFYTEPHSLMYKAFDIGLYFIDMAARYRDRTLDAIEFFPGEGMFSRFYFQKTDKHPGKENHGFYIVNYSSDYQLKIQPL